MAQFLLTAKQSINRPNGFHLDKGTQIMLTIPVMGIMPGNLFNNNRCKNYILQQFKMNGINIPETDCAFYSRGNWDVKML